MKTVRAQKIYFPHIPKTGGVSIEHTLSRISTLSACPAYYGEELLALGNIDNYGLFQGHLQYFCKDFIGEAFTFTILRDPVERAISGFQHIHRDKSHPSHHLIADSPDIISALEVPKLRVHMYNAMTLFLGLRPRFHEFKTQKAAIHHIMKNYDEKEVLDAAKKSLLEMDFIGFTETLNLDQHKLVKILNPDMASFFQETSKNQNPDKKTRTYRETLPDYVYEKLKEANRLDYELYEFALRVSEQNGWRQSSQE
jgi:hypothetical protein